MTEDFKLAEAERKGAMKALNMALSITCGYISEESWIPRHITERLKALLDRVKKGEWDA